MINDTVNAVDCLGTGEEGSNGLSGGLAVLAAGDTPAPLPIAPVSSVPEPGTLPLFGFGLAGLLVFRKKLVAGA